MGIGGHELLLILLIVLLLFGAKRFRNWQRGWVVDFVSSKKLLLMQKVLPAPKKTILSRKVRKALEFSGQRDVFSGPSGRAQMANY